MSDKDETLFEWVGEGEYLRVVRGSSGTVFLHVESGSDRAFVDITPEAAPRLIAALSAAFAVPA